MRKKILLIIISVGCLLIIFGSFIKLSDYFSLKHKKTKSLEVLSVEEAISGDVAYYLTDDKRLIITYDAKNTSNNDVKITAATLDIQNRATNEEIYHKKIDIDEKVKAKENKMIVFENVQVVAEKLTNYNVKVEVE